VIGVESTSGTGSTFWIELGATTCAELAAAPVDLAYTAAAQDRPVRAVLYVEDNMANLKLVEALVARRPDLRLTCATNATTGIELARAHLPDVILMDINLPGMSGVEAMKILRDDPATKHIPVLAISANAMMRDLKKGAEVGFFRYLTKPINVTEFMDALTVALEFARAEGEKPTGVA
jgi:CheY-like chemotaxis protein